MITYLDTSSLVKLYVEETHSETVRRWGEEAEILATCRIAYPEMISALNRRLRQGDISKREYSLLTAKFFKEWHDFVVLDFSEVEAGNLIDKYGLRGFDAVHLSAAKLLKGKQDNITVSFSSFDEKLNKAALSEGFTILSP